MPEFAIQRAIMAKYNKIIDVKYDTTYNEFRRYSKC
jgi:hypothetical protein